MFKLKRNNLFVSRIQGIAELVLFSLFYTRVFPPKSLRAFFIKLFIFVFLGIAAFDLYLNGFNSMDNISLSAESILLMIYAILAFFNLLQNPVHSNILAAPLFWFNTAIFVYFSVNFFLFLFSNYLQNHYARSSPALWGIHSLLNITFYCLIATGFWKTKNN